MKGFQFLGIVFTDLRDSWIAAALILLKSVHTA